MRTASDKRTKVANLPSSGAKASKAVRNEIVPNYLKSFGYFFLSFFALPGTFPPYCGPPVDTTPRRWGSRCSTVNDADCLTVYQDPAHRIGAYRRRIDTMVCVCTFPFTGAAKQGWNRVLPLKEAQNFFLRDGKNLRMKKNRKIATNCSHSQRQETAKGGRRGSQPKPCILPNPHTHTHSTRLMDD